MSEASSSPRSLEERTAEIRHSVRNRLAAIRNATFYLRRQAEQSPAWKENPKIQKFYDLICSELEKVDLVISEEITEASLGAFEKSDSKTTCDV